MSGRRRLAATGIVAVLAVVLSTLTATTAAAQGNDPSACENFGTGMVQRDSGTAVEVWLDHRCWFAQPIDITFETRENGVVRDHVVLTGTRFDGRTVRRVELAAKPLCTYSTVEVEASYRFLSIGDDYTVRRTIWYDPNDNCDA